MFKWMDANITSREIVIYKAKAKGMFVMQHQMNVRSVNLVNTSNDNKTLNFNIVGADNKTYDMPIPIGKIR